MVRLTSRSYLHLLPEDAAVDFDHPFYARVTSIVGDQVSFIGLLDAVGIEGTTSAATIRLKSSVVRGTEVTSAPGQSIVRCGAVVQTEEEFRHGQVLQAQEGIATIDVGDAVIEAPSTSVEVVSPVVALILRHMVFETGSWTGDELAQLHNTILQRLAGTDGTNDIAEVLANLIEEDGYPDTGDECEWVEAGTGELRSFLLQHAIDFTYYVDGSGSPTPSDVGKSFCRPPSRSAVPRQARLRPTAQGQPSLFDPLLDDDAVPEPPTTVPWQPRVANQKRARARDSHADTGLQPGAKRLQVSEEEDQSATSDRDARILERLMDKPELVEHFLQLRRRQLLTVKEHGKHAVENPVTATRTDSPVQHSKFAFTPQEDQTKIHLHIAANRYRGKQPTLIFSGMVDSSSVLFKPLLGVLARTFDFQFGSRGLSIMHFRPMTQSEKISWKAEGGANFNNFSATAEFEKATQPQSTSDLLDAVTSLLLFGREFYGQETQDIIKAMEKFVRTMSVTQRWTETELAILTYWINDVLEDYRTRIWSSEASAYAVIRRCSLDDELLRRLMHEMQLARLERLEHAQSHLSDGARSSTTSLRRTDNSRQGLTRTAQKLLGSIPTRALGLLPKKRNPSTGKDLPLCMRYLSNDGCTSSSTSKCHNRSRLHFVPSALHKEVIAEIDLRFGGLKAQYASLDTSS